MHSRKLNIKHIAVSSETLKSSHEDFLTTIVNNTKQKLFINKYRFLAGTIVNENDDNDFNHKNDVYKLAYIPLLYRYKLELNTIDVPEMYLIDAPQGISPKLSLSVLLASIRIYSALFLKAKCVEKDTVLILNSGSSWGYLACQLASLTGCGVIAETNSMHHLNFLKKANTSFNAKRIIQSSSENLAEAVKEETFGAGVDCIIDFYPSHSPDERRSIIESLAVGGGWVTIDPQLHLDLPETHCLFYKNASLHFLFDEAYETYGIELGKVRNMMKEALNKLEEGKLKVYIEHEYSSVKEFEDDKANVNKCGSSIINIEK